MTACLFAGGLQENDILQQLAVMTEVAKKYQVTTTDDAKQFGSLHIVFNRVGPEEMLEGPDKRRSDLLGLENKPLDSAANGRDLIRQLLISCFESIDCHLLPSFGTQTEPFPNPLVLAELPDDGAAGEYKRCAQRFLGSLTPQLASPRMVQTSESGAAKPLTGPKLRELMFSLKDEISKGDTFLVSAMEGMAAAKDNAALKRQLEESRQKELEQAKELKQKEEEIREAAALTGPQTLGPVGHPRA
jgi:hypothetical protein